MESKEKLPIVHLELNSGSFRIPTSDAIYEITVTFDSSISNVVEKIVEKEVLVEKPVEKIVEVPVEKIVEKEVIVEVPVEKIVYVEKQPADGTPEESAPAPAEAAASPATAQTETVAPATAEAAHTPAEAENKAIALYKEISEEMFNEIGRLARDLSISIQDLPGQHKNVDIEKAGIDLESAKGLLEDVVKMTENATMNIMDISEDMQEQCETIKQNLDDVRNLQFIGNTDAQAEQEAAAADPAAFIQELLEKLRALRDSVAALPVASAEAPPPAAAPEPGPEAAAEPETKVVQVYHFDLDVVFQTVYELCTNEAVKKHIKAMREAQAEAFDSAGVEQGFSDMAPGVEVEETFYNFPLEEILKMLFKNCNNEKHKQILKKMHQSAAQIFLDQILPIEGTVEEKEIAVTPSAPEPQASAPPAASDGGEALAPVLEALDGQIAALEQELERLQQSQGAQPTANEGYSMVKKDDHDRLIAALESADKVIQCIIANISRILEALSFQDLSGQRIVKIVEMLSSVQVQLLGILVSFGVKLKRVKGGQDIEDDSTEAEVDEWMSRIKGEDADDDEAGGPLDQGAIDSLLADLGF